jgi:hypothetical protein
MTRVVGKLADEVDSEVDLAGGGVCRSRSPSIDCGTDDGLSK